jgi:hypothetical protein
MKTIVLENVNVTKSGSKSIGNVLKSETITLKHVTKGLINGTFTITVSNEALNSDWMDNMKNANTLKITIEVDS